MSWKMKRKQLIRPIFLNIDGKWFQIKRKHWWISDAKVNSLF